MHDTASQPKRIARRNASGRYTRSLAHPLLPGKRYDITAATLKGLDELEDLVKRIGLEVSLGLRNREKALEALEQRGKRPPVVYALWTAYVASKAGNVELVAKLASVWKHQLSIFEHDFVTDLRKPRMLTWEQAQLRRGYAANSNRIAIEFLAAALRHGGIAELPWGTWRVNKKATSARVYEKAQNLGELVKVLRAACARDVDHARRTGLLADLTWRVLILAICGMRKGEGAGLGHDCIDLDRQLVVMRIIYQARDGWRVDHPEWTRPLDLAKQRTRVEQLLHPCAILVLRWQREELERRGWYRADGPVFPGVGGAWRSNAELIRWDAWRELVIEAGLPNPKEWVVHSLRHSMASLEEAAGASLADIQRRTGWGSLQVAERYIRRTARHLPASKIDGGAAGELVEPDAEEVSLVEVLLECKAKIEAAYAAHRALPSANRERVLLEERERRRRADEAAAAFRDVSVAELARQWLAPGAPRRAMRHELTLRWTAAYATTRSRVLHETDNKAEANKAGRAAYAAAKKVWRRALARASKAAAPTAGEEGGNGGHTDGTGDRDAAE